MKINKFEWCEPTIKCEKIKKELAKQANASPKISLVIENDIYTNRIELQYLIKDDRFVMETSITQKDFYQNTVATMTKAQTLEFIEKLKECLEYTHS